jgi:hypothetical protein
MVWMEELRQKREFISKLLERLGLTKEALDKNIGIDEIPPQRLSDALSSLPIDDEKKQELTSWAMSHKQDSLTNLINQINFGDFDQQDTSDSTPAQLPPGQGQVPHPMNNMQRQQAQGIQGPGSVV